MATVDGQCYIKKTGQITAPTYVKIASCIMIVFNLNIVKKLFLVAATSVKKQKSLCHANSMPFIQLGYRVRARLPYINVNRPLRVILTSN